MIRMIHLPWFFLLLIIGITQALTAPPSTNKIQISLVQSHMDMIELGDLRYQEWMLSEDPETRPSQMAFRMATAEMQQERLAQKAAVFLARDDSNAVVGTAELSCIQLKNCFDSEPQCRYLYVTDVVTAKAHRRKGVAATLMRALEKHAVEEEGNEKQSTVLLLHVEPENEAALGFYKALGYGVVVSTVKSLEGLNVDQLALNAAVKDQLLLYKTLRNNTISTRKADSNKKLPKRGGPAKGFGR